MKNQIKSSVTWPTFDSIKQASAATGISPSIWSLAKAEGCPAFRHGRIHVGEFLPWFFSQKKTRVKLPAGFSSWRDHLNYISSERQTLALKKDRGTVLDKDGVSFGLDRGISQLFNAIRQTFINQMPAQVVGMTEVQISAKFTAAIDQLEDQCRQDLEALAKEKP